MAPWSHHPLLSGPSVLRSCPVKSACCRPGGYCDIILRTRPGNVSPDAQPKELPADMLLPAEQLPKSVPSCSVFHQRPFLCSLCFWMAIMQGFTSPRTGKRPRKRNVKELAKRSQRIFAHLDPIPKPKVQAATCLCSTKEKVECGQARVRSALFYFALFPFSDYRSNTSSLQEVWMVMKNETKSDNIMSFNPTTQPPTNNSRIPSRPGLRALYIMYRVFLAFPLPYFFHPVL